MLNYEDNIVKSATFKMSFANAATVNGLDAKIKKIKQSDEYKSLNEDAKADYLYTKLCKENAEMLADIYEYSLNEAFEVTAQQTNLLAQIFNELKRVKDKNNSQILEKIISFGTYVENPFTTTLFNTAENALKYSPVGIVTNAIDGTYKAMNGKFNATKFTY